MTEGTGAADLKGGDEAKESRGEEGGGDSAIVATVVLPHHQLESH